MTDISSLCSRVTPELTGCPDVVAIEYLRDAVIEFCDRSWYWAEELSPINTVANTATYTLSAPSGESIISSIISVSHKDTVLKRRTETEMDRLISGWKDEGGLQANSYTSTVVNVIRLYPYPTDSVTGAIKARVALKPSRTATTIPQSIYDNYLEAIAAGAKSRLMAMTNQPWSNPAMSAYYQSIFDRGITSAKIVFVRGFNNSPINLVSSYY